MKRIIYQCDNCDKILSDSKTAKEHLSIYFEDCSGWVKKGKNAWKYSKDTVYGIHQFCNGKCLGNYFTKLKGKSTNE